MDETNKETKEVSQLPKELHHEIRKMWDDCQKKIDKNFREINRAMFEFGGNIRHYA